MDAPQYIIIPLTQGQSTIVSIEDADLAEMKWYALRSPNYQKENVFTATHNRYLGNGKSTTEYLHRIIVKRMIGRDLVKGEVVDHISGDTLDNRRENLRLATLNQNMWNRGKTKSNNNYKGVKFDKRHGTWSSRITVNRKCIHLGTYKTPEAAYEAYCEAAIKYHGEFARLK